MSKSETAAVVAAKIYQARFKIIDNIYAKVPMWFRASRYRVSEFNTGSAFMEVIEEEIRDWIYETQTT